MKTVNGRKTIITMLTLLLIAGSAMANPVVDLGAGSGSPCGQVVIPMTLTNDALVPVAAVSMDIGYNSTYLTPINATIGPAGQLAGKSVAKNIVTPGLFRVGVFSSSDLSTIGNGIVAYVTFEISCDAPLASYTLTNTPSTATPEGVDVDTDGSDGSIQVGEGSTTTTTIGREPVEHIKSCNVCHPTALSSQLSLAYHAHSSHMSDCTQCHDGTPGLGTVYLRPSKSCATCHPQEDTGICNLTTLAVHSGVNPGCLTCHIDCDAETSNDHIEQCTVCHPTSFSSTSDLRLHSRTGHSNCAQCHDGTPGPGNVTADKCVVCHPQGNPGACNLVDVHSPSITGSCLDCHMNCAGGIPVTTTTTTAPGTTTTTTTIQGGTTTTSIPGETTTTTPVTTTAPGSSHTGICLACHYVDDLHAKAEHNYCFQCHTSNPGKGNVEAEKCVGCHPIGNPGTCNLVTSHGSTCITCHSACSESSTTSTIGTTTTVTPYEHTDTCLQCHFVNDLHSKPAHSDCTACHDSTPQEGNVSPGNCVACHPISGPGKCDLITFPDHGSSCVSCHLSCTDGSTTSTTTIPQGECQIISIAPPSGVKIGFGLIPRIRRVTLATNTDLGEIGITGSDFIFVGNPRGINILSTEIFGNSIEARVLFWGTSPGTYNITLGECGSTSIVVSRFGNNNTLAIENVLSRYAFRETGQVTRSAAPRKYAGFFSLSRLRNLIKSFF